jgi:hypothetical protein
MRKPRRHGKRTDQFCIHNHDTFICGRNKRGRCKQCVAEGKKRSYIPHPRKPQRFCRKGHDKNKTGRRKDGRCSKCCRDYDRIDSTKDSRFKKICINGHNIAKVGRDKWGVCKQCRRDYSNKYRKEHYIPHPWQTKQFCVHGHDTHIVGRNKRNVCKQCVRDYANAYKRKHRKESRIKSLRYYQTHKNEIRKKRKKNQKRKKKYMKIYRQENKERIRRQTEKYLKEHPELLQLWKLNYRIKHKKEIAERTLVYVAKRYKNDPLFKLTRILRHRLYMALKGNFKNGSAVRDLGCAIPFFKKYIEKKFYGKMTWKNWGKYWQLDHIVALWKFDLTNRKQFFKAINYKNMQPLTVKDHKIKSAKEAKERHKLEKKYAK